MPLFALNTPIPESSVRVIPGQSWNKVYERVEFRDLQIALKSLFPVVDKASSSPESTQLLCQALGEGLETHHDIKVRSIPAIDVDQIELIELKQLDDDHYTLELKINFFLYYENLEDGQAGDTNPFNGDEVESQQLSVTFRTDNNLKLEEVLRIQATESLFSQALKGCNLL